MNVNARMYALTPKLDALWRALFERLAPRGMALRWLEHPAPQPLEALWRRPDNAAVFMCGLPFITGTYAVQALAAPVPSRAAYLGRPQYHSEFVVRADSDFKTLHDTFGGRVAFTTPDSQSGFAAALEHLEPFASQAPLYDEVIAPRLTPRGNMLAVIDGLADVAPIDGFALDLLRRYEPRLTGLLRTVAHTARRPIPMVVASAAVAAEALRTALLESHTRPELAGVLEPLLLNGFAPVEAAAYQALGQRFAQAQATWRERRLALRVDAAFV